MPRSLFLFLALFSASSALAQNADLRVLPEALLDGKARIGDIVPLHVMIAAPTSSCCIDEPLQITVRTNADPGGGETRLTIDAESEAPFELFETAQAIIQLYRHIVVTSTADAGPGTLRAAFDDVNAACATIPCKVDFALPPPVPEEGWFTIVPETPLPVVRAQRVTLDATTQTALTGDTNPNGPEVAIDGRKAGQGIELHANCHAVVRGFALGNFRADQALWMSQDRQPCIDFPHEHARALDRLLAPRPAAHGRILRQRRNDDLGAEQQRASVALTSARITANVGRASARPPGGAGGPSR
jgi:hypothetical protein